MSFTAPPPGVPPQSGMNQGVGRPPPPPPEGGMRLPPPPRPQMLRPPPVPAPVPLMSLRPHSFPASTEAPNLGIGPNGLISSAGIGPDSSLHTASGIGHVGLFTQGSGIGTVGQLPPGSHLPPPPPPAQPSQSLRSENNFCDDFLGSPFDQGPAAFQVDQFQPSQTLPPPRPPQNIKDSEMIAQHSIDKTTPAPAADRSLNKPVTPNVPAKSEVEKLKAVEPPKFLSDQGRRLSEALRLGSRVDVSKPFPTPTPRIQSEKGKIEGRPLSPASQLLAQVRASVQREKVISPPSSNKNLQKPNNGPLQLVNYSDDEDSE